MYQNCSDTTQQGNVLRIVLTYHLLIQTLTYAFRIVLSVSMLMNPLSNVSHNAQKVNSVTILPTIVLILVLLIILVIQFQEIVCFIVLMVILQMYSTTDNVRRNVLELIQLMHKIVQENV